MATNFCEVRDHGPGVSNEETLFTDSAPRGPTSGTGIGLRVCKSLCDAVGCRLSYHPNDVKGSVFCVTVPIKKFGKLGVGETETKPVVDLFDSVPFPNLGDREDEVDVLVVDDSAVNLKVMRSLLERLDIRASRIHCVDSGTEAIRFLLGRVHPPA